MYICAQVTEAGDCAVWSEYFGLLPPLSVSDALELSSVAFGVWAAVWCVRQVANAILNR